jgi:hypothetical protein
MNIIIQRPQSVGEEIVTTKKNGFEADVSKTDGKTSEPMIGVASESATYAQTLMQNIGRDSVESILSLSRNNPIVQVI